ncbi:MAG: MATE family efflux transporter [Lachnospiraceae bacterium]
MFYTNKDLRKLVIPLVIEQILVLAVGMADTIMISSVGEAAVSGVSLVDTVNILFVNIYSALATGGAVVAGHFLGQEKKDDASKSGWQLVYFSILFSIVLTSIYIGIHPFILETVFGNIEINVMEYAKTYLMITAVSMVPMAIYSSGAALFRAMGNSKITMWISLAMNCINICGNAILIFGFKMGVKGAAISTLTSRIFAAAVITFLLYQAKNKISFKGIITYKMDFFLIKKILYIGIPNGLENSMFQLGKILLLSLVSTFGTFAIAANAVCNTIAMFNVLPGISIGMAQLSVVSFCTGAKDIEQVKYYSKKLMCVTYLSITALSVIVLVFVEYALKLYNLSPETLELAAWILRYHGFMAIFFWVPSFCFNQTFRGAGDVIYPVIIAIVSMWAFRIVAAYLLNYFWNMGLVGVWVAMTVDWIFRTTCYTVHYIRGKWIKKEIFDKQQVKTV